MPIYANVVTRLDERASAATASQLDNLGRDMSDRMSPHGAAAGAQFMSGLTSGMSSGASQAVGALSGITQAAGTMGSGAATAGAVAAAGIAGIGVAAVAAGQQLYEIGARFDDLGDSIAVRTGAIGADLDALTTSMSNVATTTASSFEDIADVLSRVNQSLGLTGAPLEEVTKQIADLNRMTGENLNIRDLGQVMRAFGQDSSQMSDDVNNLTAAWQATGLPMNQLLSTMTTAGPAARTLGLNFDELAGLLVSFDEAGIDAGRTQAALNKAADEFADAGIDLQTGLADTITQIRGFIDAGNEAAAVDLAGKVFGARGAQQFVDAIRQGKLTVDDLNGGLDTTGDTIGNLDKQTADWAENWTILKNRVTDLAGEIGGPLFDALNKSLGVLNTLIAPFPTGPSGPSGPPVPGYTAPTLPGLLGVPGAPSGTPVETPTDIFGAITPPAPPGGGATPPPPQDIAGALASATSSTSSASGPAPKLPVAPVLPYDTSLPAEFAGLPQTASVVGAENSFMDARHTLAEKQARLTQLQQSDVATAEDVQKARNDVVDAEQGQQQAELRLYEAQQELLDKQTKQLTGQVSALSDIGAQIDSDFGISEGLSGIAENLTKFVANLAFAPVFGALQGVQAASGGAVPGAGGLIGLAAVSGAFGQQYVPGSQSAAQSASPSTSFSPSSPSTFSPSSIGPSTLQPGYAGDAALLANVPAGRYTQEARGDLTEGLADCTSAIEDLVNLMDNRPTEGASMWTGNADEWLQQRGFLPGSAPGAFNVGFNEGHMQATLPGGTPFNWGTDAAAARGGVGGTGAFDPSFTSHYYRPVSGGGGTSGIAGGTGGGSTGISDLYSTPGTWSTGIPAIGGGQSGGPGPSMPIGGGLGAVLGLGAGGPAAGPTLIGGISAPTGGVGKGNAGGLGGGLLGAAASTAASAAAGAGSFGAAGGAGGALAQIAISEISRAIQYGGEVAGIGVQGLMETFLPVGSSELAANSWLTRIAGGIAGAAPQLPNLAGGGEKKGELTPEQAAQQKQGAPTPEQVAGVDPNTTQHGTGGGQPPGATTNNNITVNNQRATEDGTGRDVMHYLGNQAPGM